VGPPWLEPANAIASPISTAGRQPPRRGRRPHIGPRQFGGGAPIVLYRIVKRKDPEVSDFFSAAALSDAPFGKELDAPDLHESVSMWSSAQAARELAERQPRIGRYIAELVVTPSHTQHDVAIHTTPGEPDHRDVWATPELLLSLVRRTFAVHR
jgi:hypothetical protein